MKYAVVILDGAADLPMSELAGKTVLEAAKTPQLDALAQAGQVGLTLNTPKGMEASSNIACTSICGYDPAEYPIGRGALEGAALDIELKPGEVALRTNLCIVEEGVMKSYSADNITTEAATPLYQALQTALDDETFELREGTGFRGILIVRGHSELLQCRFEPAHNMTDERIADYPATGPAAAVALIEDYQARAQVVLAGLDTPVSDLLAFWPGERPAGMPAFAELYGKSAAMLSGVDLLAGIAGLAGIDVIKAPGVTDGPDNDYRVQAVAALDALGGHDLVFVHVEAPDAEGHDGNLKGKLAAVEAIDAEIVRRLAALPEIRVMALPDHPTPVATKRHAAGPVPFMISGPGLPANSGRRLTEAEGAATGLCFDPGYKLLGSFLA
ncbi:MAG: 2,3-bisphosphoglycerate-independent phosphoglycerate mutase [Coriobacteriales bacterium]|jgi:2,3-bisphosphoglycerate-independent phosphoglycerate mutase|nr:2,3-bisphosphoglycerate-independent phosphoglycerate mutase [Coriobacteriales bacterium]